MKLKTSELQGAVLDWAVAKAEGIELSHGCYNRLLVDGRMSAGQKMLAPYNPSTDWEQGGPIIELERIATWFEHYDDDDAGLPCWFAAKYCEREYPGPTPLIAAMRCYVASRVGDEIELPEELKEVMA